MSTLFTEEQEAFRSVVRDFAARWVVYSAQAAVAAASLG